MEECSEPKEACSGTATPPEKAINDEMSEKERSFEPIMLMENELKDRRRKWLTKYGWTERCDFPDACWRWCKMIKGEMMMCDEREAINIEYNFLP